MHVELGRVDDDVGLTLDLFEELALTGDALAHPVRFRDGVPATRLVKPADQHLVGGVEEQHAGAGARLA